MTDRYVSVHQEPSGPGDGRPTAAQIIRDEGLEGGGLAGQTALITSCSGGIGIHTAQALHAAGAALFLTARNLDKARAALGEELVGDGERVHLLRLELDSLASVRACADEFLSRSGGRLNLLVCNAGVMMPPEGRTHDGFETQLGTNHLAHFLLFQLLRPALRVGAAASSRASRVVVLSSVGHRGGEVRFDDLGFEGGAGYDAWAAYAQSKTANLWTANEIERRCGGEGIHAWSVQPGAVLTDLLRHMKGGAEAFAANPDMARISKSPEQGAATSVWAATAAALEGRGGRYLENCQVIGPWAPATGEHAPGYAAHAYDADKETRLWDVSMELVGLAGWRIPGGA